jgi:two-component system, response regulator / RNA-binding antiterminator
MRNILLVDSANAVPLLDFFVSENDRLRKIQDAHSLSAHIREFAPDLIAFNLPEMTEPQLETITALLVATPLPVMVLAASLGTNHIQQLIQAGVCFINVGSHPDASASAACIDMALARFQQIQDLKHALEDARTQLEDRKQIDRAKAILIKTRSLSEDDAYHTLRKLAMGRNITLGEMARNVIAMADLLK